MLSWINSLFNIINAVVTFLINSIKALILFITKLPYYIEFIFDSLDILPSVLIPFAYGSIGVFVIYLILSREAD